MFRTTTQLVLMGFLVLAPAGASVVVDSYNGPPPPGGALCCYWGNPSGKIGWYWTPSADVSLEGIETQLYNGASNINNNFTMTVTVFTDRPDVGGTSLGSFSFNAATASGGWGGGSFALPLSLTGGTQYFVGFSGYDQVLTGSGGGGINYVAQNPFPAGTRTLSSAYYGNNFENVIGVDGFNAPVIRFLAADPIGAATPEPRSLWFMGTGLLALGWRRYRR